MADFPLQCVTDVSLKYKYGRLALEVPLPSRKEKCLFFLRPMLMSVGDLITDLQREDPGATASVLSAGRTRHVLATQTRPMTFLRFSQWGLTIFVATWIDRLVGVKARVVFLFM